MTHLQEKLIINFRNGRTSYWFLAVKFLLLILCVQLYRLAQNILFIRESVTVSCCERGPILLSKYT